MAGDFQAAGGERGLDPPVLCDRRAQTELTDEELVERIRKGDPGAWQTLYHRHTPSLIAWLASRSPGGTDVEGLVQDAWLSVARGLSGFRYGRFRAWLYTIARNALVDYSRLGRLPIDSNPPDPPAPPVQEAPEGDPRAVALRECLQELDSTFVATVRRVKIDGESVASVANSERISAGTVCTRIARGLEQLGRCIEGELQ